MVPDSLQGVQDAIHAEIQVSVVNTKAIHDMDGLMLIGRLVKKVVFVKMLEENYGREQCSRCEGSGLAWLDWKRDVHVCVPENVYLISQVV